MVFPSIPVYLDPPNWQHQVPGQPAHTLVGNDNSQLPPLPSIVSAGSTSSCSSRPGSMADRAKLAKIPQPEAGLKCPRCDSTKTKFCYFNNYSLTQPRHFCKTCRRYWTRGGALRNVPVGGGCRRNKKTKNNQNNSCLAKPSSAFNMNSDMSGGSDSTSPLASAVLSHGQPPPHQNHLPLLSSLSHLPQYQMGSIGLNFSGIGSGHPHDFGFQIGSNPAIFATGGSLQLPFFDSQSLLNTNFSFQQQAGNVEASAVNLSSSRVSDQFPQLKMEERKRGHLLGTPESGQLWQNGGAAWTDLSGLNSSTTSHSHLL